MSIINGLLFATASLAIAAPAHSQAPPASTPAKDGQIVKGATPDRVAQIQTCQGHKFESVVEIDPVKKRSTRVKLCANPGSSDADWVGTLEAAIAQIEQRDMPPAPKGKLVGELRAEIAKFEVASKSANVIQGLPRPVPENAPLIAPAERFETSVLPPLAPRKVAVTTSAAPAPPRTVRPMRIELKCLERGQSESGAPCIDLQADTILVVRALEGLEVGGTLRFLRRGEARGEVALAPMRVGQSTNVRLPGALCKGINTSKVEIELFEPKSVGTVSARLGPYPLRC